MEKTKMEIHIPIQTILKVVLVILVLWLLYFLKDIVVVLITAFILAVVIDPLADYFSRHKIPRAGAVLAVYLVFLALFALIVSLIIPPIFEEVKGFLKDFLNYWEKFTSGYTSLQSLEMKEIFQSLEKGISTVEAGVSRIAGGAYGAVAGFFGSIFQFVLILVLTFYMVVQEGELKKFIRSLIPKKSRHILDECSHGLRSKLGSWLRSQLILMVLVWFLVYVGLSILGVPYALILSIIAGLLEVVPYIGPVLAAIPAVFFALTISPWKAVFAIALFIIVQQIENNLLVPKIMQKTVGLNPIISIVALIVGAKLAGILGAILAIPITLTIKILLDVILIHRSGKTQMATQIDAEESDQSDTSLH